MKPLKRKLLVFGIAVLALAAVYSNSYRCRRDVSRVCFPIAQWLHDIRMAFRFKLIASPDDHLLYRRRDFYLDGGSLGFMFDRGNGKELVIVLLNPDVANGVIEINGRKTQRILVSPKESFGEKDAVELKVGSHEEDILSGLLKKCAEQAGVEKNSEVGILRNVLITRRFDWNTYSAQLEGKGFFDDLRTELPKSDPPIEQDASR